MAKRTDSNIWNSSNVQTSKARIKASIEAAVSADTPGEEYDAIRLSHIATKIQDLEQASSTQDALDRYIYCMHALLHQERWGGLKPSQTRDVFQIALAILRTMRIDALKSRLGYLYGELYQVMSQIQRREGLHWEAAWEQQVANLLSGSSNSDAFLARQRLGTAIRAMRIGQGEFALQEFAQAEKHGLEVKQLLRCRLGQIQLRRFRGEYSLAHDLIQSTLQLDLDPHERKNLLWDAHCLNATQSGNLNPLLHIIQPKADFFDPVYFLEGYLWRLAHRATDLMKLPQLSSVSRARSVNATKAGLFFRCANAIEKFTEKTIPLERRLHDLGEALRRKDTLISIDKELLVLAAAARVLSRQRLYDAAASIWREYRKQSWQISSGKTEDCLNISVPAYDEKEQDNPQTPPVDMENESKKVS